MGKLERGLEEASAKGWTVVDMKKDWNVIYPAREEVEVSRAGKTTRPHAS